jgi:hypothetical protein
VKIQEAASPRPVLVWTAVTCLFTAVSLFYFWPLARYWGDHIGPDLGDPLFVLWVLKWGAHQIRLGLPDFWNANIFYPTRGALAFSDHLLGPAAELFLFLKVFPNAIAGYNFLFVTSFVGSALAVCWMLRKSGLSWPAAVLAGWMYAFSSFRLSQIAHLQILIAQWIPLTLWCWDRQPPLRIKEVRRWERRHGEGPERQMEKVYGSESDGIFVYRVLGAPAPSARDGS